MRHGPINQFRPTVAASASAVDHGAVVTKITRVRPFLRLVVFVSSVFVVDARSVKRDDRWRPSDTPEHHHGNDGEQDEQPELLDTRRLRHGCSL
jgi:hypothetical protein